MAPGRAERAFVGNRPLQAVHDFDGDGADDFAYNDVYYNVVLSGRDGRALYGRQVTEIFGRPLNYAYLFLADLGGAVSPVLHGPTMHTMAQTADMRRLWFRDFGLKANHFPPALAVVGGEPALGMPGEDGVFRCLSARDGRTLWEERVGHPGADRERGPQPVVDRGAERRQQMGSGGG